MSLSPDVERMTADPIVLDDRYELGAAIGRGGMADVHRATDRVLHREVAIKLLREVSDPAQRARFIAEAHTLAPLNHPGLVTLLDAGIAGERPYLVMELVEGATLSARIHGQYLDAARIKVIGRQIAEALAYAHRADVVHRDVKPSNVLVTDDDRALLADFGIARLVGSTDEHTKAGDTIGSPAYLAPEQVAGEPLTPAVDVFALGLVLLEALTGTRAYPGTPMEAAVARLTTAPTIPEHLEPGWRSLLARMTHRLPENRPTAEEVALELGAASITEQPPAIPDHTSIETGAMEIETGAMEITMESSAEHTQVGLPTELAPTSSRRSRTPWLVAAGVVAAGTAAIVLAVSASSEPKATPDPVLPSGVPTGLQDPLKDLHRAIEGDQP